MGSLTPFPIGAWVRDDASGKLTGGMVKDSFGVTHFEPYRGQVVATGRIGKLQAYRIKFGNHLGIVMANDAECDSCGTRDDSTHSPLCYDMQVRPQKGIRR